MGDPVGSILVRDATSADLAAVVAMYADDQLGATREQPSDPLPDAYPAAFEQLDADPRHRLVVADEGGEVVATLQLSFIPHLVLVGGERAQIEAVRVRADRRGAGLGHQLIGWAIEQARERGCVLVQLTTNAARHEAVRFYEDLGFEATHVGMKLDMTQR
jgi:GNAT superfamily N-acetyltransferase